MQAVTDILCDLIKIRTDVTMSSNADFVDYIVNILKEQNVVFDTIPNSSGRMHNIFAGINVSNLQDIKGGMVLSGHMDTVGVSVHDWQTNPFCGFEEYGKIFGRGAVDMKQFIAVALGLLPKLKQIATPIFLAFSCDEETNVQGVQEIIQFMSQKNIHPQYALIGEATDFKLGVSHRGYVGYQTIIKGMSGHAGTPKLGTNAAYIGARIALEIEKLNQFYAPKGTTLNVGFIQSGVGRNSIPGVAMLDWEIRYKYEIDKNQILKRMDELYSALQKEYKNAEIVLEKKEALPVLEEKDDSRLTQIAQMILKTNKEEYPYASEAGFLQSSGMDTLICGAGNAKLAHAPNEWVAVKDLERYADFLLQLLCRIS